MKATEGARSQSGLSGVWLRWALPAALLLAVVACYWNGLSGPFVFDDVPAISDNASIRHAASALSPPNDGSTVMGRPILNVSFALDYRLGGKDVRVYHATNLAIHALAVLVLFAIVLHIGKEPVPAFAVALLWAVHPLQTESVIYLAQRAESLMGFLYLLTLYGFLRYAASPPDSGRRRAWAGLAVAACALGMATKENMASAPVVALLCDAVFVSGGVRAASRRHGGMLLALASTWVLLGFLVFASHGRADTVGFASGVGAIGYWESQLPALARYACLAVWPTSLTFDYGLVWLDSLRAALPGALVLAGIVGTMVLGLRYSAWRQPAFLAFAACAILAPTSLVPGNRQTLAEHRLYLPLAACAVGAVWLLRRTAARIGWPRAWIPASGALAFALGAQTFARNRDYRSDVSLWRDTVLKASANPFAHINYGVALHGVGANGPAEAEYRRAVQLDPQNAMAHNDLGNLLLDERRFAEAAAEYAIADRLDPAYVGRGNRGIALAALGRWAEARDEFEAALKAEATPLARTHANLAKVLRHLGRADEAIREDEAAVRLEPRLPQWHFELAASLAAAGRTIEGQAELEACIRLDPQNAALYDRRWSARLAAVEP